MAFKQGTTPIEKHLMSSSISSFTDKVQNYYNFIKQQIKMQLDRFHATELLEQQNQADVVGLLDMLKVQGPRPGKVDEEEVTELKQTDFKLEYKPIGNQLIHFKLQNAQEIQGELKPFTPGRAVSPGSGQEFGQKKVSRQTNQSPYAATKQAQLKIKAKNDTWKIPAPSYNWKEVAHKRQQERGLSRPVVTGDQRKWLEMINDKIANIYTDDQLLMHGLIVDRQTNNQLPDLRRIYDGTADSAYEEEIPDEQREMNSNIMVA